MFIYFAEVNESGSRHVKIGKAKSVPKRFKDLRRGGEASMVKPVVELLAAVKGDGNIETFLHQSFNQDRLTNAKENFRGSNDLLDYIRWLRNQYFVAIEEDDCHLLEARNYDSWSPDDKLRRIRSDFGLFSDPWEFSQPNFTSCDYHTPESIMGPVRSFFGKIDMDPASHPLANRRVKADVFYTRENNGLEQKWAGRVWLNPPFKQYSDFADKLIHELNRGEIVELIALFAIGCQSAFYMQPVFKRCDAKIIIAGRHNHEGKGKDKQSNTGHGMVYFGNRKTRFCSHFAEMGICWEVVR